MLRCHNWPQSEFSSPQLMANKIMALICRLAISRSERISATVNFLGPCQVGSRRMAAIPGRLNAAPYRIGLSISPAS